MEECRNADKVRVVHASTSAARGKEDAMVRVTVGRQQGKQCSLFVGPGASGDTQDPSYRPGAAMEGDMKDKHGGIKSGQEVE